MPLFPILMLLSRGPLAVGRQPLAESLPLRQTANGQPLTAYTETLPGSLVKVKMAPVAGPRPFWIATTETPWEAYDVFLQSGPPSKPYDQTAFAVDAIARPSRSYILPDLGWGHNGYPAINLSFTSVEMFCRWLSHETKKKYRVPTEAEWELSCRDGVSGDWKIDKGQLDKVAWYSGNSASTTHPVGKKLPNKLGLYDMLGNVGEWATDAAGKPVLCGGSFQDDAKEQGPMTRKHWSPEWQETDPQLPKSRWWLSDGPFCGFRLVCEP